MSAPFAISLNWLSIWFIILTKPFSLAWTVFSHALKSSAWLADIGPSDFNAFFALSIFFKSFSLRVALASVP